MIPAGELRWRFSRSSGPGGQHVNTTDTRAELRWDIDASGVLSQSQRERIREGAAAHLVGSEILVTASEHRSQMRNRDEAARKLAQIVRAGLAPPPPKRRATKPTKGSIRRHAEAKRRRSQIKKLRQRPPRD